MRLQLRTIFFDLDGTLFDNSVGIVAGVQHACERLGIAVPNREELLSFIGPPLRDHFNSQFGLTGDRLEQGIEFYREYFEERGVLEFTAYPGIGALLDGQLALGRTLAVATCKPEAYAERILVESGLRDRFQGVFGCELDGERSLKDEVLRYGMEALRLDGSAGCMMVGDRSSDVTGARAVGMDCIGVLYGFGDEAELRGADAAYIVDSVGALAALLTDLA